MAYSLCQHVVFMKLVERDTGAYYIGNCNMDLNLRDTVLILPEPKDGKRETILIIKRVDENRQRQDPGDLSDPTS